MKCNRNFAVSLKTKILTEEKFWFPNSTKNCIKQSVKRQSRSVYHDSKISNSKITKFFWNNGSEPDLQPSNDFSVVQTSSFSWKYFKICLTKLHNEILFGCVCICICVYICLYMDIYIFLRICMVRLYVILYVLVLFARNSWYCLFKPNLSSSGMPFLERGYFLIKIVSSRDII